MTSSPPVPNPESRQTPLLKYTIESMKTAHIPAVSAIEKESFTSTWPASAYRREIERNELAYYVVARRSPVAGPPRRERRFPVTGVDALDNSEDSLLSRLGRMIRGEARHFSADEAEELESIVGYTGMWVMVDEAHVTTIAVDPAYRGEGIGEYLLIALIDRSMEIGINEVTLECRVSNNVAQALYRKYTFRNMGVRKHYYSDDGEDALIMTTASLYSDTFQQTFAANRELLMERMQLRS
ncbi:MAG: [ribosomal protein S18]-alanine N-acetyltransferase [Chloroflexota bacterium]|jgi:ribosomal-protein-alanine N-acetyltransferase|nr:[ribosomal protein S18]-alanine N-acetyltransferase [Solirubrobacteraceae bacterium]MEA2642278.1 [ribosomal protein S18]-alanine N-acetyltransferase [Chloroflexota bacterium]